MNFSIRRAENRDLNRVVELLSDIANEHHNGRPDLFKRDSRKFTASELRDLLIEKDRFIFVAVDDSEYVLGYAFCYVIHYKKHALFKDLNTLYIDDICIDESVRSNGIGKSIFKHCKDYAVASGCYNIELNVWSFNERAVAFYRSLGMETQCMKMELIINQQ